MPLVEITLWPGRSAEVKEQMMKEVTEAIARTSGAPRDAVEIIIRETPKTDWCKGGVPFCKSHPDK